MKKNVAETIHIFIHKSETKDSQNCLLKLKEFLF